MAILSRADLLRCLKNAPNLEALALADALGFESLAQPAAARTVTTETLAPVAQETLGVTKSLYSARKQYRYWVVSEYRSLGEKEVSGEVVSLDAGQPKPFRAITALKKPSLLTAGEWQNCWDETLQIPHAGKSLDLPKTLKKLYRAEPLQKIVRKERKNWNHQTVLILDRNPALRPIWSDLREGWLNLRNLLGEEQLSSYFLDRGPTGSWWSMGGSRQGCEADIDDQAHVVLLGCFGALETGRISADWRRLIERLQRRCKRVLLLSFSPLHETALESRALSGVASNQAKTLLTLLSQAWRPSLTQLRWLRLALPQATVVDELKVYNHPCVEVTGELLGLKSEVLLAELKNYQRLSDAIKKAVQRTMGEAWQQSLGSCANEIETLQRSLRKPESLKPEQYGTLLRLAQLTQNELQKDESGMAHNLMFSMLPVVQVLAEERKGDRAWDDFLAVAQQVAKGTNQRLPLEHQEQKKGQSQWLRQIGSELQLRASSQGALLQLGAEPYHVESGRQLMGTVAATDYRVEIKDQQDHWVLKAISKPNWADAIWMKGDTLHAEHNGTEFLLEAASPKQPKAQWRIAQDRPVWAGDMGVDEYGLWADLEIKKVTQRLRWIAAGTFLMGSPEDEAERRDNETQHEVMLSKGYWLADTACTQKLWSAVMAENPSEFKDDLQNPVEMVSWDDCQTFIAELNEQVEGLTLHLPSEAEWEYACRAGTETVFSFGDSLSSEQANFKNEVGQTVPVRSYHPNSWGLWQMHGNVWEWCQDWLGDYSEEPVVDPKGVAKGRKRVLRGGGWIFGGQIVRSADRNAYSPDLRVNNVGLRLAGGDPQAGRRMAAAGRRMAADRWERSERALGGDVTIKRKGLKERVLHIFSRFGK